MLILTRKTNETIHIGPDVELRILWIGRDRVSVGLIAPAETVIVRGELLTAPLRVQQRAARAAGGGESGQ